MNPIIVNQLLRITAPGGIIVLVKPAAEQSRNEGAPMSQMIFKCIDADCVAAAVIAPPYDTQEVCDSASDLGAIVEKILQLRVGSQAVAV